MKKIIKRLAYIFSKSVTTLNIESDSVRLVRIKGRRITKLAEEPVPQGVIKRTQINDPDALGRIVRELFKKNGVFRSGVVVAMNNFRSVPRMVTLPRMSRGRLKDAVKWAANREMPVPLDTLYVSWQVTDKNDKEQMVFLLGTPKEVLDQLKSTLKTAGVRPKAIESKPLAIARLIGRNNVIEIDMEDETISMMVQSQGLPMISQTVVIRPENVETDDRIKSVTDALYRVMEYQSNRDEEVPVNNDSEIYLTGGIVNDSIISSIKHATRRNVMVPETDIELPEGVSPARYAVNLGLYLREVNRGFFRRRKKDKRTFLRPDIRKAKSFKL